MKKFKTKGELKALSVSDFSPPAQGFKCVVCYRQFEFEVDLEQHMKTSTGLCNKMVEGKTGHVCVVCKKKFKTPSQLSYHEMYHTADEYKQVREEAAAESKPPSRESISDSADEVKEKSRPKPKTSRKQSKPEKNPMEKLPEAVQNSPATPKTPVVANNFAQGGKKKVSCEKCKKKFSDSMTLEYHKITFHAIVVKPKAGPKSREFVDDSSDSETENPKTVKTPVKRKQESPKGGVKKFKRDTSSSEDDPKQPTKKSNSKPAKRVLTKKVDIRDVKSKARVAESRRRRGEVGESRRVDVSESRRGRGEKTPAAESSSEESESEDEPPRTKKPMAKVEQKVKNKTSLSSAKPKKTSQVQDEEKAACALADEMDDVRLHFVSPKNEKVPCGQCGRLMANATVLAYHEIRCTGTTIKRKLSQDSNRTLSTDSRADSRASIESTDKKVKKSAPKKQQQPAKKFVKSAKTVESSESGSEEDEDEEKSSRKVVAPPPSKTIKKSAYSSSEEEDEEEKKEDTVPEKTSTASVPKGTSSASSPKETSTASSPKETSDDFHSKFSSKGFTEIPPANLYREKLFSTKGSKVKCEFCGKSFKNEQVLGHHNIYCTTPKVDKSKPKPSPAKSKREEVEPAKPLTRKEPEPRTPDARPDFVERTIIKNRASQSPVDLILKKLTGGVNNHTNRSPERSTADDATNSGSESTGSAAPIVTNAKASTSPQKVESVYAFTDTEDEDEKNKGSENENDRESERENDRLADNKVSIYTSSEDENGDHTSDSGPKRLPAMHPNARHGVEILEEEMRRKKLAKKEKKAKKAKKKAKKAKKKRSSSESEAESTSVVVAKPRVSAAKSRGSATLKPRGAQKAARTADKSDSDSTNSSDHAESAPRRKTKKNPNYCFCDKPENNEMIGCDYCDMWYHPECLGLDEKQTQKLTESSSWMCPECVDSTDNKKSGNDAAAAGKNGSAGRGSSGRAAAGRQKDHTDTESESESD